MASNETLIDKIKEHAINFTSAVPDTAADNNVPPIVTPPNNLYIELTILESGHVIKAGTVEITLDRDTLMVFSDDDPNCNWSHDCRYLLYDASKPGTEPYKIVDAQFPPYFNHPSDTFILFHEHSLPLELLDFNTPVTLGQPTPFPVYNGGQRYALLYSGLTRIQHLNDLEYIYRILIHSYGFKPDNIFVLNYDGTYIINWDGSMTPNYSRFPSDPVSMVWPGDGTHYQLKILPQQATHENLLGLFNELNGNNTKKRKLQKGDLLFIHTNNEGTLGYVDVDGHLEIESAICTYPLNPYSPCSATDFTDALNSLPKCSELVVLMEQCHSGGFKDPVLEKSKADYTCFMSAVEMDQKSLRVDNFDVFAVNWFRGITGYVPASDLQQPKFNQCTVLQAYEGIPENYHLVKYPPPHHTPVFGIKSENKYKEIYLGLPQNSSSEHSENL